MVVVYETGCCVCVCVCVVRCDVGMGEGDVFGGEVGRGAVWVGRCMGYSVRGGP